MAGQRLPLEVVQARGSKHLTKAEIKERQDREIKPITDNIIASFLLKIERSILARSDADHVQLTIIVIG